jgi:hypothetical protein
MNITQRLFTDGEYQKTFFGRLKELDARKDMFADFTRGLREAEESRKKAAGKKEKRSGVIVSGATSKRDIARLRRILLQKISEVAAEESDQKLAKIRINDLQRKLFMLDSILADIERIEREQAEKRQRKHKKDKAGTVYLSGDDLTVNKNGVAVSTADAAAVSAQPGIDLAASFEAVAEAFADAADASQVDVQL